MNIYKKLMKKPMRYLVLLTAGLVLLSTTAFADLPNCGGEIANYPGNKTTLMSASATEVTKLNACLAQNYCTQSTDVYCGLKLTQLDFAANLSANATKASP